MNRVIHVWAYDSFEERSRVRAESQKLEGWPPNIREFVTEQQSEIFLPALFSPKLEARKLGNLYEIRTYTLKPAGIPGVIDRWITQIAERIKLSPLAGAWHSEFGGLNRWCHIWAYKDAAERFAVREEIGMGNWIALRDDRHNERHRLGAQWQMLGSLLLGLMRGFV